MGIRLVPLLTHHLFPDRFNMSAHFEKNPLEILKAAGHTEGPGSPSGPRLQVDGALASTRCPYQYQSSLVLTGQYMENGDQGGGGLGEMPQPCEVRDPEEQDPNMSTSTLVSEPPAGPAVASSAQHRVLPESFHLLVGLWVRASGFTPGRGCLSSCQVRSGVGIESVPGVINV